MPGIGVAPVGLETAAVGVDRLVEVAFGAQHRALTLGLPAILVDPAEEAERLAARPAVLNHVEQHSLGVVAALRSVEGEPVLLTDERRPADGLGHRLDQADHLLPALGGAKGEQQVDEHAGLDVFERAEVVLDLAQCGHAVGAGGGEPRLDLGRVRGLVAKDVGLQPIDLRRRQLVDQLEHRAVGRRGSSGA